MSDTRNEEQQQNRETAAPKSRNQEFDEAVDRVYQRYGPDLSEFVRAVQRDLMKHHSSADDEKIYGT